MKVVLISTSDKLGGASVASYRLGKAFDENNLDATMLVRDISRDDNFIQRVGGLITNLQGKLLHAFEKLSFIPYEKSKELRFQFSSAKYGIDISKNKYVLEADIIHLHWINNGFLSWKSIEKLVRLGKPIVWTLHDRWVFTGGCHITKDCLNYEEQCGNCYYLKSPRSSDLSHQIWMKKQEIFRKGNFTFITCSQFLGNMAKRSGLLSSQRVISIPNPIDTTFYFNKPNTLELRAQFSLPKDKFCVLFIAGNIANKFKGLHYLIEALELIFKEGESTEIELVVVGKDKNNILSDVGIPYTFLGLMQNASEIVDIYNAVDIFVTPSIEDNLPNVVMESMACETPVIGFKTGGIPEMVDDGINGFIVSQKDVLALKESILKLYNDRILLNTFKSKARKKIVDNYSNESVTKMFRKVYQDLLN